MCAALLLVGSAAAQSMRISTVDGQQLAAEVKGFDAGNGTLSAVVGGVTKSLSIGNLLALHGGAPTPGGSVEVHLVGGELLQGDLVAGDADGETFGLQSPTLGRLSVPIDRLEVLIFRERARDARPQDFAIPESADADEALFRRARRLGFQQVLGGIHRFREKSILFEVGDGDDAVDAEAFRYEDLVAIALRGGVARETPPEAMLLTRSGDVVGVDLEGFRDGKFRFGVDVATREFELAPNDIAALTFLGTGRKYLSDLPVLAAEERAYFEDAEVLLPYRRDRNVGGGFLVAGGSSYLKGVGAHSYSKLSWKVPDGVAHFHALVGLGDEVGDLGLKADVGVTVKLDDEVLFFDDSIGAADGVQNLGLLDVRPGATLTLEVKFGRGLDLGDRVGWLGAVFLQ